MHSSAVFKCKCFTENEMLALTSSMCLFLWRVNILMSSWINNVVCAELISEEGIRNVARGVSFTLVNKLAFMCGCRIYMQMNWTPAILKINHKLLINFAFSVLLYEYTLGKNHPLKTNILLLIFSSIQEHRTSQDSEEWYHKGLCINFRYCLA